MSVSSDDVIDMFRESGALLEGHFVYASGRHGSQFIQAARVMQYPDKLERLCGALADLFRAAGVDLVVGPATGGILLAYETARQLGCRGAFVEKDGAGGMALKRGFALEAGTRVLVVEDIVTTGGSVQKAIDHLRARGAEVVGVGVLIDRSSGGAHFDCPFHSLARLDMKSYAPDDPEVAELAGPPVDPDDLMV